MKKRIGTREYDTDKAKLVGELVSDKPVNDFGYYEEKLYRKLNGTYFLWGKGNGLTKYATKVDDMKGPGETIIPLTYNEAQQWYQKAMDRYEERGREYDESINEETYRREFTVDVSKGSDEIKQVAFNLPESLSNKLSVLAKREGMNRSELIAKLIEEA
ncbi:hypothetical protein [Limosilactobacillus fermentum]